MPFTKSGIATIFLGAQTPFIIGPSARTVLLLDTFPKGPDVPMPMSPAQMSSWYGDPTSSASIGYTGPYRQQLAAIQAQPQTTGPIQFLVCRVGVTRGTYAVLDGSSGTTMTLSAIGAYAGSASTKLKVAITVASGKVTSLTFSDDATGTSLLTLTDQSVTGGQYDLSSNAKIVAAINGAQPPTNLPSVVQATIGASSLVPAAVTPVQGVAQFSAGTDGLGAAYNDATIAPLLAQSLNYGADYVTAGFDGALIGPTLLAHVATAVSQNQFRKCYLGPAFGTTYNLLTSTYLGSSLSSSRLTMIGHDGWNAIHPARGSFVTWDGFYAAAALAGLKAAGGPEQSCYGMSLAGFVSIAPPSDKPAGLLDSDKVALSALGYTTFDQVPGGAVTCRDVITTIPQQTAATNTRNIYSAITTQEEDDAVATALNLFLRQDIGQPGATSAETDMKIANHAQSALSTLPNTIAGNLAVSPYRDVNTGQIFCPVTFYRRDPTSNIILQIANATAP